MAADDARRVRELEMMCMLLEQMLLVQEKRVWSQQTLKLLEEERRTKGSSTEEQRRARDFLESNLRVARESLDRLAHELGYEDTSVRKLLQGDGFSDAPEVPASLDSRFDRIDAREREAGTSHLKAMYRDLTRRHDAFLSSLAELVKDDVQLNASFSAMANL